ncbi:MAG: glycosyltransferase [Candidatus Magasanikbacteria bacterium]|jgi:alpha(1,3/1,4) fucosyltransferase|nr:glycosyltransferase [Candidatus Magasanikbacteria bacterium]MBT4314806.1 glycosyltransferase [Candidatus Magasanikbacteria bacterium]MBT4547583.1 glycosyltransferase [Candidatus Magasanikbacteria bacterium]MBT6818832.1 glycosyltransferase [Candidatus Magasanikbacteria bacterium]
MKKIKIKICDFDDKSEATHFGFLVLKILEKYYDVEFSEDPDYLFYHESTYEHLEYDCVKIFYTGENISPNFNLCDYAIGCDYMNFEDRYYRFPVYMMATFYNEGEKEMAGGFDFNKPIVYTKDDLVGKSDFCSFVYSNYLADTTRKIFFDKLSSYKKVNAGGGYLNNIGGRVGNKLEFELKHKFSIAFENSSRLGYTTEKIVTSLVANTIPIYWGNPEIGREFNKSRIINCHDYGSFDEVVERIKDIDENDDLYLQIVNEPIMAENYSFDRVNQGFEVFLRQIFDQKLSFAKRSTINPVKLLNLEKNERVVAKYAIVTLGIRKIFAFFYKPFKKIKLLENLKIKYFRKNI